MELHSESIEEFGGNQGVRDAGLIESALGAAINEFHYGRGDLIANAAAYAFHMARSQAFIDGNKRTAVAAAKRMTTKSGLASQSRTLAVPK